MSNAIRRAAIYKLASAAQEMDLDAMHGIVRQDADGRWWIGSYDLERWLKAHEGQELVAVMGSLDDDREVQVRTCRTCGRDYQGLECPYCRENRLRLRGRA